MKLNKMQIENFGQSDEDLRGVDEGYILKIKGDGYLIVENEHSILKIFLIDGRIELVGLEEK